eukprot:5259496-Pyramimonas_sp.AAC.1
MRRLERWFKRGRERGREVRNNAALTRLRHELAIEQDGQLHPQKIGHKRCKAEILKRVTKSLSTFQINQTTKKGT